MLLIESSRASRVPVLVPQGTAAFSFDQSHFPSNICLKKYLKNYNWLQWAELTYSPC